MKPEYGASDLSFHYINYGYMMKLQVPNRWSGSVDYMEHLIAQE